MIGKHKIKNKLNIARTEEIWSPDVSKFKSEILKKVEILVTKYEVKPALITELKKIFLCIKVQIFFNRAHLFTINFNKSNSMMIKARPTKANKNVPRFLNIFVDSIPYFSNEESTCS